MTGWWGNFGNWLNSPQGWIFYVVILVFLVSILANLVGYVARRREGGAKKVGYGGMVALVGAVITLTAIASLPWESYASFSCAECGWSSAGFGYGQGSAAIFVLVTGLLWFTLFGIPRRVAAVLGFAWGLLALVLALQAFGRIAAEAATAHPFGVYSIEYGVYVGIFGPITLLAGVTLAFVKTKAPIATEPIAEDTDRL